MTFVLGVDEAGRGPLAGPVAVGAVSAPVDLDLLATFPGLNDSKKLTEKGRERLFTLLEERAGAGEIAYRVELVGHDVIDREGIVPAVRRGVERAIAALLPDPAGGKVWLDGLLRAPDAYDQETVVHGDGIVPAIMLASVAAKVTRDRHMKKLAEAYPLYGFERHKGYGTSAHYRAIREHGLCAIHRTSYVALERMHEKGYTVS